ncbi:hypothetical protein DSCA_42750 [Desulfosarcina alkanivorans]|jgi:hypothetical protein|uniref:Uncharacterized protein n=1 Tax=Desulfosarcina alkanivorans TaxID=571177 RepID=A0A5K7YPS1_9BACT|nr:hypothetical protein [Desulfosarcina alkanivorans]BBO70345.1 hypothetical protein DSCA_42750 [Desulfosarcina alkanivorans]
MFDLMHNRKRPGRNLVGFKSEIDNLFNRFVNLDFPLSREILKEGHWSPRVDVSERERDITIGASYFSSVGLRKGEIITLRRNDAAWADAPFQMVTSEVIRCEDVLNGIFNYKVGVRHLLTYF